jgi:hypothetical protein
MDFDFYHTPKITADEDGGARLGSYKIKKVSF